MRQDCFASLQSLAHVVAAAKRPPLVPKHPKGVSLSPFPQQFQARAAHSQAARFFSRNPYPAQTPVNAQGLPSDEATAPHHLNLEFFCVKLQVGRQLLFFHLFLRFFALKIKHIRSQHLNI
jgi:hypothetical protein